MDRYTTIFGGREALTVPGETEMTVGPVESHSIFGTDVTAADADIPSIAAPARGPVDMTPMPIVKTIDEGPIPIDDKVLYGMSTFGGPVRDVAGLGGFSGLGAELMLEQTKHGDELVQAAAGLGRYVPYRGDLGRYVPYRGDLGANPLIAPNIIAAATESGLFPVVKPESAGGGEESSNTMMYVAIGVGVLALAGAAYYYTKS